MGHYCVLVIGENARDQFDKFQRAEYAHPTENKYLVAVDVLEEVKAKYERHTTRFLRDEAGGLHDPWDARFWRPLGDGEPETGPADSPVVTNLTEHKRQFVPAGFQRVDLPTQGLVSLRSWITQWYGFAVLGQGEEPDVMKTHRGGWMRVNEAGEVIEAMERTIPNGIWDWFEGTVDLFKLKPGATGLSIRNGEKVVSDCAGAARKGAIDLASMRADEGRKAAELWDKAASARGPLTWERYDALCKQHNARPFDYQSAAWIEYRKQAAIEAMYAAGCSPHDQGASLDKLGLPREEYAAINRDKAVFQHFSYVVKDGEIIYGDAISPSLPDLNKMLDELSDDTLLTAASMHA